VTFEGPPEGTQILTGVANKVTFTGRVTPADIGARVILQRQNTDSEWHRIGLGVVEAGGGYSIPHTFLVPGDPDLRVMVLSQGRNVPETSSPLSYDISQAQNTELTIEANPDPIPYGQSVVLGGTLAGVTASQPVTLLARAVHQHGYTPVAQVDTSSSGVYTFPAQMPVSSTFYKVQGDGKSSAVLFEGVKYVLTAEVSATSAMEGQVITFSGNVSPAPPSPFSSEAAPTAHRRYGHLIYLERLNASGTGFHVVREAPVGGGTFTIFYQVFNLGTNVFRLYVPGGPDNGGASSQTFTINVSPAPAASLKEAVTGDSPSTPSTESATTTEAENEGEERGGEEGEAKTEPSSEPPRGPHHHR
jgi:hypothetical protein